MSFLAHLIEMDDSITAGIIVISIINRHDLTDTFGPQ
jgi:hypothetical protein